MKSKFLIGLLALTACTILPLDHSVRVLPPSKDTMIIRQARYVNHTSSSLNFEIDAFHFKGYDFSHFVSLDYFYNDPGVDTTYFNFPTGGTFVFKGSDWFNAVAVVPSTAVILTDESGSYDTLDYYNSRSQGIAKLASDFVGPAQTLFGGFSQNGNLDGSPVDYFQTTFSPYDASTLPFIFGLSQKTGGQSNILDAVDNAVDRIAASGSSPRNIVVLAHNSDQASTKLLDDVIAKANTNQVQVHIIFRGQVGEADFLAKLSQATGGAFVICPSVGEMICALENFYPMMEAANQTQVYRIKVNYTLASGSFASGQELWFTIHTHDNYFNEDNNPILAYVKIP